MAFKKHTMTDRDNGYLAIYLGPMYSGKTSKLFELYKQYSFCKIPTIVINYADDVRYTSDAMMCTHDNKMVPCIMARSLMDELPPGSDKTRGIVFLLNEGQFFPDIVEWVKAMVETHKKTVHICGLDGDFQRKKFGNWLDLIPLCNHVEKLTSVCRSCADIGELSAAIFSFRLTSETEQRVIGSDNYIPLCRKCYNARVKP
jgi:thymidine kinase